MKIFSYSKNIKFNARPDGTLEHEENSKATAIDISLVDSVVKWVTGSLVAHLVPKPVAWLSKLYRVIRSRFSA